MDSSTINMVWEKGTVVKGVNKDLFRMDACGAWIKKDLYGIDNLYGWEIDHIYPQSKGGKDDIENLRPLQHQNNASKGDDYPSYMAVVISDGNRNIETNQQFTVNEDVQKAIKKLYNL